MLNLHNLKHNKEAFTLVEVMLLLVVLSLVFASSVSLITRKHKLKPRRSVHGQYICFREPETGVLRQVKYSGKSLLQDQREIDKCTFEAPSNSSYMYIMLVGAGGAGGGAAGQAWLETFVRVAVLAADAGRDARRAVHTVRQPVRAADDRLGERSARPV